jgi:hypothetical protein
MPSGRHELVINSQERAVSVDINRLQKFENADNAELWRLILAAQTGGEFGAGIAVFPSGSEQPVAGEIIGGLMVRPASGSFGIAIDPGIAMFLKPDGAADDSDFKYIRDPGLTLGTLSIGANVSGSIRIDVIECSINSTPATVTDSRDIFNTATGLFSATTVTKETKAQFQYRIRQGTPGSGYPTAAAGWMPLCVASVPSGASSNDNVTFWDVRPLLEDRVRTGTFGTFLKPRVKDVEGSLRRASASSALLEGMFWGELKGRVVGGAFQRCTPGSDTNGVDIGSIQNQSAAITEPISGHVYVYACTPFGLPRWAMYAPSPAARTPRGTIGLLIASQVVPDTFGANSATVALPTSTGLGGSVQLGEGLCVAVAPPTSPTGYWLPFLAGNGQIDLGASQGEFPVSLTSDVYNGGTTSFQWHLPDNFFPPNAKAIWVRCEVAFNLPTSSINHVDAAVAAYEGNAISATSALVQQSFARLLYSEPSGAPLGVRFGFYLRIPRPRKYPQSDTPPFLVDLAMSPINVFNGTISFTGLTATMYLEKIEI